MRMFGRNRARAGLTAAAIALTLGAGACSGSPTWSNGSGGGGPEPPTVTLVAPQDGAVDVLTSVELEFTVEGTDTAEVTLTDAEGNAVPGAMREDGSTWLPDRQLKYGTQYTAKVKATKADGASAEATTTFTTMGEPAQTARVQSYNGDNVTYGVAMPIIIRFDIDVPESQRAALQRRLFVSSTPAQEGIWHWVSSSYHNPGSEIHYRPKDYWQPGTQIQARVALGGMPWGLSGIYGRNDLTLDFTIGDSQIIEVDNATKRMKITRNGQVIDRVIKVSLGKASTPSVSGQMMIMSRNEDFTFDTRREDGAGGYVVDVKYAEQLTTSGQFIHAAPWSEGVQGTTNVSHGCVNVSMVNGKWIYENVRVGDPVIVKGTGVPLAWGDGFTDWNIPWTEYVKGSAIPYVPATAAAASPTA
jgi:lipoprotein-anchoring transpeptidase ErfK/SrfK